MAWTTPKTWTSVLVTVADLNTHIRDNLNMIAWQGTTWTPVWKSAASTVTLGNGTISGQYQAVGKLCVFHFELVLGSTTVPDPGGLGTGAYTFSLPLTASTGTTRMVGPTLLYDNSSGNCVQGFCDVVSAGTAVNMSYAASVGGLLTAVDPTHPWTWATSDIMRVSGAYLTA